MELSLSLAQSILVMFLMLLCGFLLVRLRIAKASESRLLSILAMYIITPCMIINAFQETECTSENLHDFLVLLGASAITHIVFILITLLLKKTMKLKPVEQASLIFTNSGNLIMPLIALTFGDDMVFFALPYTTLFTIVVWTVGRTMICSGDGKIEWKKIFLNINVVSTIFGLILFVLHIKLPSVIGSAVSKLGSTVGPICMLLAGMLIGGADLKKAFSNVRIYILTFLRLIVLPIILILVFKITRYDTLASKSSILMITMLAASAPCASSVTNIAQVYDREPEIAVTMNIVTMLLCIVTMPLINLLYQIIMAL